MVQLYYPVVVLPYRRSGMGCHEHGCSRGIDVPQKLEHLLGSRRIDVTGWFVSEQYGRVSHYRPCYRHFLLLPPGELKWIRVSLMRQLGLIECLEDLLLYETLGSTGDFKSEGDVVEAVPVIQQLEILKHDAYPSPQVGNVSRFEIGRGMAKHDHFSGSRFLFHEDQSQEGALPCSCRAYQEGEFTLVDLESYILECTPGLFVYFVDFSELNHVEMMIKTAASVNPTWP